jgi:hypothetical protein
MSRTWPLPREVKVTASEPLTLDTGAVGGGEAVDVQHLADAMETSRYGTTMAGTPTSRPVAVQRRR